MYHRLCSVAGVHAMGSRARGPGDAGTPACAVARAQRAPAREARRLERALFSALRTFPRPLVLVSSVPCLAERVGNVLSNASIPSATDARTEGSSPIPSRWFGRSLGSKGTRLANIRVSSRVSFPSDPPMANPSKGRPPRYSALSRRSASSTPPWITAYIAWPRTSLKCSRRLRASPR